MAVITQPSINGELSSAVRRLEGVTGVVLASADGRLLAAHVAEGIGDRDAVAAIVASSQQLARRLSEQIWSGAFGEITIRSTDGYVMLYSVGESAVLAVLTRSSANPARVHLDAYDLIATLAQALRSISPT